MEVVVVIVGAGPSGLATSACLSHLSVPTVILEKEDCSASLWRKRAYDRLKLHLARDFCSLPHMPHPPSCPKFMPKDVFIQYLDEYISKFNICPKYNRSVQTASYDDAKKKWYIEAYNTLSGEKEIYVANFLVVAAGENDVGIIPSLPGLETFKGEIVHSSNYKSGSRYQGKEVLVVGCGNSGMEISYDLANFGAHTSIVIRSPFHVLSKEMVYLGMCMLKYLPIAFVDALITWLAKFSYGDLSAHSITRPEKGPFFIKAETGKSPIIDVGTIKKIKDGEIEVLPAVMSIYGNNVTFDNGITKNFDAIIFATGYKSSVSTWLKEVEYLLNEQGRPKNGFPHHYKGDNCVYCVGLSRRGLEGVSMDAEAIAKDIERVLARKMKAMKIKSFSKITNELVLE